MATLESTITDLMGGRTASPNNVESCTPSSVTQSSILPQETSSQKRKASLSFLPMVDESNDAGTSNSRPPISSNEYSSYTNEPSYSTAPFSALEAQNMIQQELSQGTNLSKQKREAFHAALGSLTKSLSTSYKKSSTSSSEPNDYYLTISSDDAVKYPDVEVIQWILSRENPLHLKVKLLTS
jgi:hypothetical protein